MKYEELKSRALAWKPIDEKKLDSELNNAITYVAEFTGLTVSETAYRLYSQKRFRAHALIRAMVIAYLLGKRISQYKIASILRLNHRTVYHYFENWVLNPFNQEMKPFIQQLTI